MKAFPSAYYLPADQAAEYMRWEDRKREIKKERKEFRRNAGCSGCYHRKQFIEGLYNCSIGQVPHSGGFCGKFWDIRTGKAPK